MFSFLFCHSCEELFCVRSHVCACGWSFWWSYVVSFFAISVFSLVSFNNVCDRGEYFLIEYVYAVGSHGGEDSLDIFYYMEYVYILNIVTGVSSLNRAIPLRSI